MIVVDRRQRARRVDRPRWSVPLLTADDHLPPRVQARRVVVSTRARRHRRGCGPQRDHVVPADTCPDLRCATRDRVAHRLAQRPKLGARSIRSRSRCSCWCPPSSRWRDRCARCSSATTQPRARVSRSNATRRCLIFVAVALAAVATAAAGPVAFVAFVAGADRPAPRPHAGDAGPGRTGRRPAAARFRPHRPTRCSHRPSSPSASSPASSVPRISCGCWRVPTRSAAEAEAWMTANSDITRWLPST